MTALSIQPTYPTIPDIDGQPLEDGFIWIGVANLPPIGNPITVYWDAALTLPAAQPIRTLGGYPMNSGTPGRLYAATAYSILVQNKTGSTVYSSADNNGPLFGGTISSVDVTFLQAGAGAVERTVQSKLREYVSVKDYGAVGNGVADDTAAINTAMAAAASLGVALYYPAGTYRYTGTMNLPSNVKFRMFSDANYSLNPGFARIEFQHNTAAPCVYVTPNTGAIDATGVSIEGFVFVGLNYTHEAVLKIDSRKFEGRNIRVEKGLDGIKLIAAYNGNIDNFSTNFAGRDGVRLESCNGFWFRNFQLQYSEQNSIHIVEGTANWFDGDYSTPKLGYGIKITGGYMNFFNGYYENNTPGGWDRPAAELGTETRNNVINVFFGAAYAVIDRGLSNVYPAGQGLFPVKQVGGNLTNQVYDSSFATSVAGWTAVGAVTLAQDSVGVTAGTSMKITATATTNCGASRLMPPTVNPGDTVVMICWAKATKEMYRRNLTPGGAVQTYLTFGFVSGGLSTTDIIGEFKQAPFIDTNWRPIANVIKVKDSATFIGQLSMDFTIANPSAADAVWITDVMMVVNPPENVDPLSLPYIANNRTAATLQVPVRLPINRLDPVVEPAYGNNTTLKGIFGLLAAGGADLVFQEFYPLRASPTVRGAYVGFGSSSTEFVIANERAGAMRSIVQAGQAWVWQSGANSPMQLLSTGLLKLPFLPTYANNAAAIAGGLVQGDVYQTATGELRIVV